MIFGEETSSEELNEDVFAYKTLSDVTSEERSLRMFQATRQNDLYEAEMLHLSGVRCDSVELSYPHRSYVTHDRRSRLSEDLTY